MGTRSLAGRLPWLGGSRKDHDRNHAHWYPQPAAHVASVDVMGDSKCDEVCFWPLLLFRWHSLSSLRARSAPNSGGSRRYLFRARLLCRSTSGGSTIGERPIT